MAVRQKFTQRIGGKRDIQAMLELRIVELCQTLLPAGRINGAYWSGMRSPLRDEKTAGAFYVRVRGQGVGLWCDHCDTGTYRGNAVQLIAACNGWDWKSKEGMNKAYDWARAFLGEAAFVPAAVERARGEVDKKREAAERERLEQEANQRRHAHALWLGCQEKLIGTLGDVYLRDARGIDLRCFARPPAAVRFHPSLKYYGLKLENGNSPYFPALVGFVSRPDHTCGGVHRIYLQPDGSDKAHLPDGLAARLLLGQLKGNCIRIWNGQSGLPLKEANQKGVQDDLVICEGIEDAMAIALAAPEYRVWAAIALGNLGQQPVDMPSIRRVFVWADNDWGKPAAMKSFDAAFKELKRKNPNCEVVRSPVGKDANDLLKGI